MISHVIHMLKFWILGTKASWDFFAQYFRSLILVSGRSSFPVAPAAVGECRLARVMLNFTNLILSPRIGIIISADLGGVSFT